MPLTLACGWWLLPACASEPYAPAAHARAPLATTARGADGDASPDATSSRVAPADGAEAQVVEEPETFPELSDEERQRIEATQRFVAKAAKKHGVDRQLINGVIWVESRFQARARGKHGPRGLMQIMPRTARSLARELGRKYEPYSADFNVDAGTLYIARMLALWDGDVSLALASYAAGPATVKRSLDTGEPLSPRIQTYVRRVLTAARMLDDRARPP